ncbi:unnamed protein product, partial [Mesorhabditis spiculigera]
MVKPSPDFSNLPTEVHEKIFDHLGRDPADFARYAQTNRRVWKAGEACKTKAWDWTVFYYDGHVFVEKKNGRHFTLQLLPTLRLLLNGAQVEELNIYCQWAPMPNITAKRVSFQGQLQLPPLHDLLKSLKPTKLDFESVDFGWQKLTMEAVELLNSHAMKVSFGLPRDEFDLDVFGRLIHGSMVVKPIWGRMGREQAVRLAERVIDDWQARKRPVHLVQFSLTNMYTLRFDNWLYRFTPRYISTPTRLCAHMENKLGGLWLTTPMQDWYGDMTQIRAYEFEEEDEYDEFVDDEEDEEASSDEESAHDGSAADDEASDVEVGDKVEATDCLVS